MPVVLGEFHKKTLDAYCPLGEGLGIYIPILTEIFIFYFILDFILLYYIPIGTCYWPHWPLLVAARQHVSVYRPTIESTST